MTTCPWWISFANLQIEFAPRDSFAGFNFLNARRMSFIIGKMDKSVLLSQLIEMHFRERQSSQNMARLPGAIFHTLTILLSYAV